MRDLITTEDTKKLIEELIDGKEPSIIVETHKQARKEALQEALDICLSIADPSKTVYRSFPDLLSKCGALKCASRIRDLAEMD